ncbi:thioredoxin domain-containing protein [Dysgonomonas sp. ZJ709]|uniref:thioredoxin domain-containing protein n=1 Tax=Dysgonomonas sp. ZJ709 TaxID=2709797 RepID=UPI0013EC92E0|nr:thioredoxin domain-containing protein [Dysgonomonas sp. ZJ709]
MKSTETKDYNIIAHFLKLLKVKHTTGFTSKLYNEHPHKYNMFGLRKMLSEYNIENVGVRINNKEEDIHSLEPPFIAHTGSDFVVVEKITPTKVHYNWQGKQIINTVKEFIDTWSGVILVAEPTPKSIEPFYKENKKNELFNVLQKKYLLISVCILLILSYFSNSLYTNIWANLSLIANFAGIYICHLLVQKQLHIQSNYADKICSLFKESDCNNILDSDSAKLWGVIGWSEAGLSYFISNVFVILLLPQLISYMVLINICILPYSFWSVWFQKFKAKQWCPLCLLIQVLLWAIFIINIALVHIGIPVFSVPDFLLLICVYTIPFILINLSLPAFARAGKIEQITQEINSIKATNEVFASLLKKQSFYQVSKATSNILIGNPDASILITIFSNPHCSPCAKMHQRINKLLKESNGNLCVQYIFSSFEEKVDISNKFMTAIYFEKDKTKCQEIYDEWFETGRTKKEEFFEKYKVDMESEDVNLEFSKHNAWKEETGLRATPTIIINGYKLPDNYKIEDLKYFSKLDL